MKRGPFQGCINVIRFNWHFFALAGLAVSALLGVAWISSGWVSVCAMCAGAGVLISVASSLIATYRAYDGSGFYRLEWLDGKLPPCGVGANIHAGFDETTGLLWRRCPGVDWTAFDFYDPARHTEVSIRRARSVHPPAADTVAHSTSSFPADDASIDVILLTLAAHEIRDHKERITYFKDLRRVLKPDGVIIVTEHLRDPPNWMAYHIGALHFHSSAVWLHTFREAGLALVATERTAPLITTFTLRHP